MGGCSSKPKTTEFEGAMDLQDEPATKSLDAEKKGLDAGLKSIDREQKGSSLQNLSVENERGDLRDVLLESEKKLIKGFNPEDNGKRAEEKYEETCDHSSAKHTEGETPGSQKELSVAEGETRTPAIVERQIAPEREALKLQKEPVSVAAEAETLEILKESVIVSEREGIAELQEEAPGEVEKESEQSQTQKPIYDVNRKELDAGPGYGGGAKQGEEGSKEGEVVNDGAETVGKVDSAEREEDILKKANKPVKEEEKAQSKVIGGATEGQSAVITSRSLDNGDTTAETSTTSSKPPSEVKENDTSCVGPPAMTDLPEESTLPADETEALMSREPAPIEVPKESMDSVQGGHPVIHDASKSFTSDQVKAPQDLDEGLVIEHEGHPAASQSPETMDVSATTENSSRSEVKSVHVTEGNKHAKPISSKYISAQDIAPPDIDAVLEKLASEFERQESLSSSMR